MSTPYSEIYDLYSGMYSDYEHLNLTLQDQDDILEGWLLNSVGKFKGCKKDLSDRSSALKQFNIDLDDDEKGVLAQYMLVCWLSPKLYSLDNIKSHMSNKDFNLYSPANMLKEIRSTYELAKKEANNLRKDYVHKNFNPLEDLL